MSEAGPRDPDAERDRLSEPDVDLNNETPPARPALSEFSESCSSACRDVDLNDDTTPARPALSEFSESCSSATRDPDPGDGRTPTRPALSEPREPHEPHEPEQSSGAPQEEPTLTSGQIHNHTTKVSTEAPTGHSDGKSPILKHVEKDMSKSLQQRQARRSGAPVAPSSTAQRGGLPWTRGLLALVIGGPALAIGGVAPEVVIVFLALLFALWIRLGRRSRGWIELPWPTLIGVLALTLTALQAMPLPAELRQLLAPGIALRVSTALSGTGIDAWPSLSPTPADSALEAARLTGLTLLFIIAAQLPWRFTATVVSVVGALIAGIGLLQAGLGTETIFGLYRPLDIDPNATPALLTTFVNPNHQADLFLLALFAATALLTRMRQSSARDAGTPETRMLLWACVFLVGAALLLSLSRGALLALVFSAPPALAIAWLSGQGQRSRGREEQNPWWRRLAIVAAIAGITALIASAGAWAEMMTLIDPTQGPTDKLKIAADALPIHDLAPIVGVGRGAFIDLFPAFDRAPGSVVHTHLESAPATLWVEWGLIGVLIGASLLIAWLDALRRAGKRSDAAARRVALFGLGAVAMHSFGDFSLEFLGVAAPAVALFGALAGRGRRISARSATAIGALALALALPVAVLAAPHTWSKRDTSTTGAKTRALRVRPLDAHLHRAIARTNLRRTSAQDQDLNQNLNLNQNQNLNQNLRAALHHATVATSLRPGESESWLLRAAAERRQGKASLADASTRRALAVLTGPPSPELVTYLLAHMIRPAELGPLLPEAPDRWAQIVLGIVAVDASAGLEVATTRSAAPQAEFAPVLKAQASAALVAGNAALAIHYARLLVRAEPTRADAHLLLIRSLEISKKSRQTEIQDHLRRVLDDDLVSDEAELALLEEALIVHLLHAASAGDRQALNDAMALLDRIQTRPGDRAALRRRHALNGRASEIAAATQAAAEIETLKE